MSLKRKRKGLNAFFSVKRTVKSTNGKRIFSTELPFGRIGQAVYFPWLLFNYA